MDNYYSNQIKTYNDNYDDSITKVGQIIDNLKELKDSFYGANGEDIEKIENDLNALIKELQTMKETIANKKSTTNKNVANSDDVFILAQNLPKFETFRGNVDVFESAGDRKVYIDPSDGRIYFQERIRIIPKEQYDELFGIVAGVGKLFDSYKTVTIKSHANVDSMIEGKLELIPERRTGDEVVIPDGFLSQILNK